MSRPAISLVIPVFNMALYLPQLLESIDEQREPGCPVEIIFVDDGSTDGSDQLLERWVVGSPFEARLIKQPNGGVSNARNSGLAVATGAWVTFPDSDDVLDRSYLYHSWRFLRSKSGSRSSMVVSRVLRLNDSNGRVSNDHPLRFRFENGTHVLDMNRHPDYFQLHAASTFFRREVLASSRIRFPEGVSASEDAMFIMDYLLSSDEPRMGINPRATYLYRRRVGDTTVARYIDAPDTAYRQRFGEHYARLLFRVAATRPIPEWLQSMVLYELHWALAPWQRIGAHRSTVSAELGAQILDAFSTCARFLSDDVILRYDATAMSLEIRLVLLALKGSPLPSWVPEAVDCVDVRQGRTRWRRWELVPNSTELAPISPVGDWVRSLTYFATTPVQERYEWRDGVEDVRLTDRASAGDRARRRAMGQQRWALGSRISDMRVRRVRWVGGLPPVSSGAGLALERLRGTALSKARWVSCIGQAFSVLQKTPVQLIFQSAEQTPEIPRIPGLERRLVNSGKGAGASAGSLRTVMQIYRAARIDTDDPRLALGLLRKIRPRATQWELHLWLGVDVGHDEALAIADASAFTATAN